MAEMKKTRPPLLRATVVCDWEVAGKRVTLSPDDPPTRDVPAKVAAWMVECGALVPVDEEVPDAG